MCLAQVIPNVTQVHSQEQGFFLRISLLLDFHLTLQPLGLLLLLPVFLLHSSSSLCVCVCAHMQRGSSGGENGSPIRDLATETITTIVTGQVRLEIPGKQGIPQIQHQDCSTPCQGRQEGRERLQIKSTLPQRRQGGACGAEGIVLKAHCIKNTAINCKGARQPVPSQQGQAARGYLFCSQPHRRRAKDKYCEQQPSFVGKLDTPTGFWSTLNSGREDI